MQVRLIWCAIDDGEVNAVKLSVNQTQVVVPDDHVARFDRMSRFAVPLSNLLKASAGLHPP
jgi:hypothetical protein